MSEQTNDEALISFINLVEHTLEDIVKIETEARTWFDFDSSIVSQSNIGRGKVGLRMYLKTLKRLRDERISNSK